MLVDQDEVTPQILAMAGDVVARMLPELDLGAVPRIQWFADTREMPAARVAAAREVYVPGDGDAKAGSVPPFVRYVPGQGWDPAVPVIMLNRSQCLPDTPLHELRHLWQIKQGLYRADEDSTPELEADADAWAAAAVHSLGLHPEPST